MKLLDAVLDLLYPPKCAFCGTLLREEKDGVCESCAGKLPVTNNGGETHGDFFSVCISPLFYEGDVRDSVLRCKFHGGSCYCAAYGRLVAGCVREHLTRRFDFVSWVPLSNKRLRSRGYDQARLIAESASASLETPCLSTLKKHRHVPAQSGISGAEKRRANISGVYCVPNADLVRGKRILLIDDVRTTGSTLSECARMLLMSGAEEIMCATLAGTRQS